MKKLVLLGSCSLAAAFCGAAAAGSAAANLPQCRTTQLAARTSRPIAGLGHDGLALVLTNRSATSCRTGGYVGLLRLDAHHRPLRTVEHRGSGYLFRSPRLRTLILRPDQSVSAGIEWLDASTPTDPPGCPVVGRYLKVTPPDERTALTIHARTGDCHSGFMSSTALQHGTKGPRS